MIKTMCSISVVCVCVLCVLKPTSECMSGVMPDEGKYREQACVCI